MSTKSLHPAGAWLEHIFASDPDIPPYSFVQTFRCQPRLVQGSLAAILFALIAALDFSLDRDLSLFALYLIPTLYSAWFLGVRWGYMSCFASALVWLADDWEVSGSLHQTVIPYWNLAEKLIVLTIIVAIVNALKGALEAEFETERRGVQRELELAVEVQSRLLPWEAPRYPGFDFGFFYKPARDVGGDYYDFIPFSATQMGLVAGDVSGKGLSSSLLMASLQGLVRTNLAIREGDVGRSVSEISASFHKLTADDRYATLFLALVDSANRTVDYVNAGHNPPLLFRQSTQSQNFGLRTIKTLNPGGPPVGVLPNSRYRSERILLHDGDVLVAYTDGVVEAQNLLHQEFGESRLCEVVRSSLSLSAADICKNLAEALEEFLGEAPQSDDVTLVVMKVQ
jgi:serine phosphatase RsbU (regulator of sigma subunit)